MYYLFRTVDFDSEDIRISEDIEVLKSYITKIYYHTKLRFDDSFKVLASVKDYCGYRVDVYNDEVEGWLIGSIIPVQKI